MHVALLALMLFCDASKFHQKKFTITQDIVSSTIVFMPLKKHIAQPQTKAQAGSTAADNQVRNIMHYDAYQKSMVQQPVQPKKVVTPSAKTVIKPAPVPVKKAAASVVKKAATSLQTQVKKEVKKVVKPQAKKVEKKVTPVKKIEPIKKPIIEKKVVAVSEKKQEVMRQAIQPEPIVAAPVAQVMPEVVEQAVVASEPVAALPSQEVISDAQNVTFVGAQDLEMIEIQDQIKHQVMQHYKPPVGIAKKAICELAVVVGPDGKGQRVTVKKSSGSLANDMCARAALLKIKFPKEVIGQEIIVELGQ